MRSEPAVAMTEQLATVLNLLPRKAATALIGSMFKGADFVTSNVPGAPFPLYLGGAEIEQMYAFGPLSGTATNVTLLSPLRHVLHRRERRPRRRSPSPTAPRATSAAGSPRSSPSPDPAPASDR